MKIMIIKIKRIEEEVKNQRKVIRQKKMKKIGIEEEVERDREKDEKEVDQNLQGDVNQKKNLKEVIAEK